MSVRPPQIRASTFHLISASFTPPVPNSYRASCCYAHLPHGHWPCMKFLFVGADVCRRLPSDSASPRTPLPWAIAFPLLGQLRDFHPLAGAHAERTYEECLARTCRTRHPYIFIWTFQQSLPDRWLQKFVKSFIINFCSFMNYM